MTLDGLFFWAFTALTLGGGAVTVLARNPVHAAVALIVSLLGTAGLFLCQQAEFLFAVQIILYVGGVMVLFLFVIMLVNLDQLAAQLAPGGRWRIGAALVLALGAEAGYLFWRGGLGWPASAGETASGGAGAPSGNTEQLADVLFQNYLVPFEVASLLLLAAIVGSVLMARGAATSRERPALETCAKPVLLTQEGPVGRSEEAAP